MNNATKEIRKTFELLIQPTWSYKEIMAWCHVSKTTAIKIKDRAIEINDGAVQYGSNLVKTDAVLAFYGTSREQELKLYRDMLGINEND